MFGFWPCIDEVQKFEPRMFLNAKAYIFDCIVVLLWFKMNVVRCAHKCRFINLFKKKKKKPKAKYSTFEEHIFHFGSRSHLHIVIVLHFVYKIEDSFPFPFSLSIASCRTYSYTIFLPSSVWSPAPNLLAILWWNGIHKRQIFRQELIWFSLHGNGCYSVVWCLVDATYAAVFIHRMGVFMYKSKPLVAKPSNTKQ